LITLFFQIRWVSHRQMVDPKIGIPEKHLDSP
jgi:hypothetical protein